MLTTIAVILLVLWALGLITGNSIGGIIHILLVIAIIMILLRIIKGENPFKQESGLQLGTVSKFCLNYCISRLRFTFRTHNFFKDIWQFVVEYLLSNQKIKSQPSSRFVILRILYLLFNVHFIIYFLLFNCFYRTLKYLDGNQEYCHNRSRRPRKDDLDR